MNDCELIDKIRKDMGSYCFSVCRSKCCRRGKLVVFDKKRAEAISQGRDDVIGHEENYMTIDLSKGCPSLGSDFTCQIYGKWARPRMCHEYPIYQHGKLVLISINCDFYREAYFAEIIEKLEIDGFRIEII